MPNRLESKVIAITGGGGILCRAMARALAGEGATIAILNRGEEKARKAREELEALGCQALALGCDVTSRADLEAALEAIMAAYGRVDVLINGAGGNSPKGSTAMERAQGPDLDASGFTQLSEEGFRSTFDLNFMGSFLPSQVFAPRLSGRAGASIINISSMASFSPMTKVPAYAAAKAAVNNLTQWMAVHLAPAGIRVNAIAPGFFATEQNRQLLFNPDGSPSPRTAKIIEHTPMARLGRPEDLGGVAVWLCDAAASGFVTGAVIPVDGGFMAYSGV